LLDFAADWRSWPIKDPLKIRRKRGKSGKKGKHLFSESWKPRRLKKHPIRKERETLEKGGKKKKKEGLFTEGIVSRG